MNNYPKIWFLRHGQTEWNAAYRLQGQLDSPLTEQGLADARAQAEIMKPILMQNPAIFASPLGRAKQTAEIALSGRSFQRDDRLMEIHAGDWQGRYRAELMAEHPEWGIQGMTALDIYEAAEGGEGITAFHARICAFLETLTQPSVIVAHGLLGQVLRAQVCDVSLADAGRLSNHQGCVYQLEGGHEEVLGGSD